MESTELQLGSARGGKIRPQTGELLIELVRELGPDDREMLERPPAVGSQTPELSRLRHNHHQVAMWLAAGMELAEVSLASGLSISRISILQNHDPAFRELVAHYQTQRELAQISVIERMTMFGQTTLDELIWRMENHPEEFSIGQLAMLTELMLLKGRTGPGGVAAGMGAGPNGGVQVNVQFVSGQAKVIEGDQNGE